MKKNIFILCIAFFAIAFVSCSNNEPEMSPVQDGKVSFNIPAPAINAEGNQSAARKITGNLDEKFITFKWEEEDTIDFNFYNSNKELISSTNYIVKSEDMIDDGVSVSISVEAPSNAIYATASTGPDAIPTTQYHEVDGMHSYHMRFETNDLILLKEGENDLPMNPIWSAIIITPTYTYYFDGIDNDVRKYISTTIGMDSITLTQTIGSEILKIKYTNLNRSGNEIPITKTVDNGGTPTTPYIIVVKPTEQCDLAIALHYNETRFKGKSNTQWEEEEFEDPFELEVNTPIQTISMHTEGQSVPAIEKGQAYDIPVMSHPLVIHWITKK